MAELFTLAKDKLIELQNVINAMNRAGLDYATENKELREKICGDKTVELSRTIVQLMNRETENTAIITKQSEDIKEFESLIEGYRQNIHRLESNVAGYKDDIRDMNATLHVRDTTVMELNSRINTLDVCLQNYRARAQPEPNLSYGRVVQLEQQVKQLTILNNELNERNAQLETINSVQNLLMARVTREFGI